MMEAPLREDRRFGEMLEITCRNHTAAEYLTKNIKHRSLHFVKADPGVSTDNGNIMGECLCPASDLVYTDTGKQVYGS